MKKSIFALMLLSLPLSIYSAGITVEFPLLSTAYVKSEQALPFAKKYHTLMAGTENAGTFMLRCTSENGLVFAQVSRHFDGKGEIKFSNYFREETKTTNCEDTLNELASEISYTVKPLAVLDIESGIIVIESRD